MPLPAQRLARPTLAGNIHLIGTGAGAKQTFPLRTPTTGTAWNLEAFALTVVGPAPLITEDLYVDLLVGGEVADTFSADSALIVAGSADLALPLTIPHNYPNPYTIFDTNSLELRFRFAETPATTFLDYRYVASLKYA